MNWADLTNGMFEAGTGLTALHSCYKLYQHKRVQGVSHWLMVWVSLWGYWNLYYYPSLDQWLSFTGGLLIVSANTIWLSLAWRYRDGKSKVEFWKDTPWTVDRDGRCATDKQRRKVVLKAANGNRT